VFFVEKSPNATKYYYLHSHFCLFFSREAAKLAKKEHMGQAIQLIMAPLRLGVFARDFYKESRDAA